MRGALPLLLIAGCGGDPPAAPVPVTVHTGSAVLVAVDPLGDGTWQRLPPQAAVTLEVGERWLAASVCGGPANFEVIAQAYGAEDGADVELPCGDPGGTPVQIAVTVLNGGPGARVQLGYAGDFVYDGAGTMFAFPGTWDLYAEDLATSRVVIQRGVVIDDGTALAIDFETEGFALDERRVSAIGELGAVSGYAQVSLAGGTFASLPSEFASFTVPAIPTERLEPGDVQRAHLSANDVAGNGQFAHVQFDDGDFEVTLPPPLEDPTLQFDAGGFTATWRVDAESDRAWLWADHGLRTDGRVYWSFLDPAAAAAGSIEYPDLSSIDGWDPAWNLQLELGVSASVSLVREVDAGEVGVSWHQSFGP